MKKSLRGKKETGPIHGYFLCERQKIESQEEFSKSGMAKNCVRMNGKRITYGCVGNEYTLATTLGGDANRSAAPAANHFSNFGKESVFKIWKRCCCKSVNVSGMHEISWKGACQSTRATIPSFNRSSSYAMRIGCRCLSSKFTSSGASCRTNRLMICSAWAAAPWYVRSGKRMRYVSIASQAKRTSPQWLSTKNSRNLPLFSAFLRVCISSQRGCEDDEEDEEDEEGGGACFRKAWPMPETSSTCSMESDFLNWFIGGRVPGERESLAFRGCGGRPRGTAVGTAGLERRSGEEEGEEDCEGGRRVTGEEEGDCAGDAAGRGERENPNGDDVFVFRRLKDIVTNAVPLSFLENYYCFKSE